MRALRVIVAVLSLVLAALGCVEPDLGQAPVYCNKWEPRCPDGYVCVEQDQQELCVREGASYTVPYDDGGP